jgi:hypothetical protein
LGLGRASALALAAPLDLAGDSADAARRRCGNGDGLCRGKAAAAPAAPMASDLEKSPGGLRGFRRFKMGERKHGSGSGVGAK